MEYLVINGKVFNCYNQAYDNDSNMYLRVPCKNSRLCDTFNNINYNIKNSYTSLEKIRQGYKCSNEDDLIEIESTCIKCNDETLQNISRFLNQSTNCLKELHGIVTTANVTQPEFTKQYKDCMNNLSILESFVEEVDNEVIEELFESNFLQSTLVDKFFKIITFGYYQTDSSNVIQQVGKNLELLQSSFSYLDTIHID